jgi:hypothetical protein
MLGMTRKRLARYWKNRFTTSPSLMVDVYSSRQWWGNVNADGKIKVMKKQRRSKVKDWQGRAILGVFKPRFTALSSCWVKISSFWQSNSGRRHDESLHLKTTRTLDRHPITQIYFNRQTMYVKKSKNITISKTTVNTTRPMVIPRSCFPSSCCSSKRRG